MLGAVRQWAAAPMCGQEQAGQLCCDSGRVSSPGPVLALVSSTERVPAPRWLVTENPLSQRRYVLPGHLSFPLPDVFSR